MMTESKGQYNVTQGDISNEAHISIEIDTTMDAVPDIIAWLQEQARKEAITAFSMTYQWNETGIPI